MYLGCVCIYIYILYIYIYIYIYVHQPGARRPGSDEETKIKQSLA